jgi:hypothetical protein
MANRTYEEAAHAMQAGVAVDQGRGSQDGTPKHLRVGINAAMSDMAGLVRLLISKGIFTEAEYIEAITAAMNHEADRYEKLLSETMGRTIKLG